MGLYLKIIHPQEDSDLCEVTWAPLDGRAVKWGAENMSSGGAGRPTRTDLVVRIKNKQGEPDEIHTVGLEDEAYLVDEHGDTVARVGFVYKCELRRLPVNTPPTSPA